MASSQENRPIVSQIGGRVFPCRTNPCGGTAKRGSMSFVSVANGSSLPVSTAVIVVIRLLVSSIYDICIEVGIRKYQHGAQNNICVKLVAYFSKFLLYCILHYVHTSLHRKLQLREEKNVEPQIQNNNKGISSFSQRHVAQIIINLLKNKIGFILAKVKTSITPPRNTPISIMSRPVKDDDDGVWNSPITILSKFDIDADGLLNYKEFQVLCVELFGADEVKEHESKVQEIFKLFDTDADGTLDERELHRCCEWIHVTVNPVNVLVVVDVQNDFIDGELALRKCGYGQEATEVVEPINKLSKAGHWDKVIYTLDWHPKDHISFFENLAMRQLHSDSKITKEMAKVFDTVIFAQPHVTQKLWPKHCVKGTWGAELHKDLFIVSSSEQVRKGQDPDVEEYSAFGKRDSSELARILSKIGATHLYICGLAYDICVYETCLEALRQGYRLAVVDDCCRGTNPSNIETAKNTISESGGLVASSKHVLSLVNNSKRSLVMAHHATKSMF